MNTFLFTVLAADTDTRDGEPEHHYCEFTMMVLRNLTLHQNNLSKFVSCKSVSQLLSFCVEVGHKSLLLAVCSVLYRALSTALSPSDDDDGPLTPRNVIAICTAICTKTDDRTIVRMAKCVVGNRCLVICRIYTCKQHRSHS